jgi:fructuronate reductase
MALVRLGDAALAALPEAVAKPRYDRAALRYGIVHLGVGAFQRAHLAVATEAALHAWRDLSWGIAGVSLRSPDTRDALAPQQGLYTVALRDADDSGAPRQVLQVVGCLRDLLVAPEAPGAVLERIAHPHTRIVSLTMTEKGYCHDPARGTLDPAHPDIAHDLLHAGAPRSAVGFIVHAMNLRRARGLGPVTLMSLDNLPGNGNVLRGLVLDFAAMLDGPLADWIATGCTFPNSMVDRIVPRTTDADRDAVAAALGAHDAWPVVAEPFFDWAVEDRFAAGRPDWSAGGARFVAQAAPWERLKLRMVNGSHSSLAYLGVAAGLRTVDAAVAQPALRRHVETLMRDEIAPTLPVLPGLDAAAYRAGLVKRFANPALAHRTLQVAMDGSQKLPQRLLGPLRERLAAGEAVPRLALGVAAWVNFLRGHDDRGAPYAIDDPLARPLEALRAEADRAAAAQTDAEAAERARVRVLTGFVPVFGELAGDERLIAAVAPALRSLRERGALATLEAMR